MFYVLFQTASEKWVKGREGDWRVYIYSFSQLGWDKKSSAYSYFL